MHRLFFLKLVFLWQNCQFFVQAVRLSWCHQSTFQKDFFNKTIEYRCTIVWFCFKNSTSRKEIQNDISNSLKCLYILYTVCYGRKMASFWQWLPGVSLLLEQCALFKWLSEPARISVHIYIPELVWFSARPIFTVDYSFFTLYIQNFRWSYQLYSSLALLNSLVVKM